MIAETCCQDSMNVLVFTALIKSVQGAFVAVETIFV